MSDEAILCRKETIKAVLTTICRKYVSLKEAEKKKRIRRNHPWVRNWIGRRDTLGGQVLLRELAAKDPKSYTNALRMSTQRFNDLLAMIKPSIQRQDTRMRPAIPAELKLQVTLQFLASGDSFKSLSLFFRIPPSSISLFLPEVLQAIRIALQPFVKFPETHADWDRIASQFKQVWNFPRCCGAIDGKHIAIKAPPASGTSFYNYKGFYSIVLFAMVDADYNFTYINVGAEGSNNDAGILQQSALNAYLKYATRNLPSEHVILGDSIFPLKTYLMKPYGPRNATKRHIVFNYRLSRTRRIVENAFGILAWRFRVFTRPIELKVKTIDEVVMAACSLHNWLRKTAPGYAASTHVDYEDTHTGEVIDGVWRSEINALQSVRVSCSNNATDAAKKVRSSFAKYFWRAGAIPGQWRATGIDPFHVGLLDTSSEEDDDDKYQWSD